MGAATAEPANGASALTMVRVEPDLALRQREALLPPIGPVPKQVSHAGTGLAHSRLVRAACAARAAIGLAQPRAPSWLRAEREPVESSRTALKGESGVCFRRWQSAPGIAARCADRRCMRHLDRRFGRHRHRGASAGHQDEQLSRQLELVQLRHPLGAGRRSVCQAGAAACRCRGKGPRVAPRTPLGRPLPAVHQAGPLRRRPLPLRGTGLRIRRRRILIGAASAPARHDG